MLWITDNQDRPCEIAPFIRVSKQKCYFTADVSTYSIHEVNALGTPANFLDALYLVFDGFLPDEIGSPAVELEDLNGESVPGMSVTLGAPQYESNPQTKDIAQRVAFPIDVRFDNTQAFDAIPNGEDFALIRVLGRMGDFNCNENLTLSLNPNPRMSDGNPHWLSIDLRVFKTTPGEDPSAGVSHGNGADAPYDYIQGLLAAYNGWQGGSPHPFDQLPTDQETNRLSLDDTDANDNPVYNYAVARVRFRAPEGVNAADVRLFFRQWTTGWTSLNYGNPKASNGSYRRHGDGPGAAPLLGLTGGEVNNIPCFAAPRVGNMEDQTDETNRRTLEGADAAEVHGYFGCWLDTNQDNALFPLEPEGNGPFNGDLLTVRQHMRGLHQCLVAEIHYTLDPIASGDTPASSDNLSQRNILFDETDNPGSFSAHLVHHTFEIKASPHAFPPPQLTLGGATSTGARLHPDELAIHWGDLPRDSQATLFVPQVEVDDVLRFAASRGGPRRIEKTGPGGVRLKVGDVTYVPLPGPMPKNIASLLSIQLPPGLPKGKKYRVVVRQVDGRRRRIVGTTEFLITVSSAGEMRFRLERNLAVLRHIQLSIPASNRWHRVFLRYVGELEERVRAVGGDPDAVKPLPGDPHPGKPEKPGRPGKRPRPGHHRGKIKELLFDCFGDFEGFILEDCDDRQRFSACEAGIERVVRQACRDRSTITVVTEGEDRRKVIRIVVHCC